MALGGNVGGHAECIEALFLIEATLCILYKEPLMKISIQGGVTLRMTLMPCVFGTEDRS